MKCIIAAVIFANMLGMVSGQASKFGFCSGNRYLALPSDKEGCTLDASVNAQINTEMAAFYEYLNMGNFFAHEGYNLPHFSKYFFDSAKDELKHAQNLMHYQVLRGAKVSLKDIVAPKKRTFTSSCDAMEHAYELELKVTKSIDALYHLANTKRDIHLSDHLETHFVTEQYESLKKIKDMIGTLNRLAICNTGFGNCDKLAEFQFDKTVMKDLTKD